MTVVKNASGTRSFEYPFNWLFKVELQSSYPVPIN
jgi:hypothetical protein